LVFTFNTSNLSDQVERASCIEKFELSLRDHFTFTNAPANLKIPEIMTAYLAFVRAYSFGKALKLNDHVSLLYSVSTKEELNALETQHRIVMLYLWLAMRFAHFEQVELASELKGTCEDLINEALHRLHGSKRNKYLAPKSKGHAKVVDRSDQY
jgi:Mitochondrial degradasome RNA helicase subunit C terminal/Suv3 C-terminal domain 1